MADILKAIVILGGYLVLAPALGWVLSRNRLAERAALALMVFMPSWFPSKLTLMLCSVERYRGHTKGFEASLIEVVAVALIVSAAIRREPGFRWMPPGIYLYLGWCVLSCLSIFGATSALFTSMAAAKFSMAALLILGAFHALRDEEDLRWVLRSLAASLILQCLVGFKMRYLDGSWQVKGWFEHQNPMAMWAYFCALPLLSVALAPATGRRDTALYLTAVASAALLILLSVSRASLGAFVAGSACVVAAAAARGLSWKLSRICALGAVASVLAGCLALDSVLSRVSEASSREEEHDLRAILNAQSKAMLEHHPLGVGWNNFGLANSLPIRDYAQILMDWDESRGFRIIEENYLANPLTESLYWLLLAENGYPGFASFVVFLLVTLLWAARTSLSNWSTPAGYFLTGLLVALVLTYLHGTVERVLTQTKNLSLWLILIGCLARFEHARRSRSSLARSTVPIPGPGALSTPVSFASP
jgi:hypothetical protein